MSGRGKGGKVKGKSKSCSTRAGLQINTTFKFDVTNGDEPPDVSKKLVSNRVHSLILITA